MRRARLRRADHEEHGEVIIVQTPYSEKFLADLKSSIPWKNRQWDPDFRVWCVEPENEADLMAVLHRAALDITWDNKLHTAIPSSRLTKNGPADPGATYPRPSVPPEAERRKPSDDFFKRRHSTPEDWMTIQVIPTACREVAQAAYRALSKKYHPDYTAGDQTTMQLVNVAWARVEKDFDEKERRAGGQSF